MKYSILFALLVAHSARAQLPVTGLGAYRIGSTTPDSLLSARFTEQAVYVKGTIALVCSHVRVFGADSVNSRGVPITHLTLYFYDNRLFKLTCDYTDVVAQVFRPAYGNGTPVPKSRWALCEKEIDKPLILWGEIWQHQNVRALVVHADGYGADCTRQQTVRLTIASQPVSALSSDCDLTQSDPVEETFDRMLDGNLPGRGEPGPRKP